MPYSTQLLVLLASLPFAKRVETARAAKASEASGVDSDVRDVIESAVEEVRRLVEEFHQQRVTPTQALGFEQQLQEQLRELGRKVVQWTYNRAEPDVQALSKHVWFEASEYTRLNAKTPQNAWSLFGQGQRTSNLVQG